MYSIARVIREWAMVFFNHPASCIEADAHHVILLMGNSDYERSLLQSAVDGETPRSWRIESTVKRRNNEVCREMKTLYNLLGYLYLGTNAPLNCSHCAINHCNSNFFPRSTLPYYSCQFGSSPHDVLFIIVLLGPLISSLRRQSALREVTSWKSWIFDLVVVKSRHHYVSIATHSVEDL